MSPEVLAVVGSLGGAVIGAAGALCDGWIVGAVGGTVHFAAFCGLEQFC